MRDIKIQAARLVEDLLANGARFTVPTRTDGLRTFIYELPAGGDQERCRSILKEAKDNPLLWDALVDEVVLRSRATP